MKQADKKMPPDKNGMISNLRPVKRSCAAFKANRRRQSSRGQLVTDVAFMWEALRLLCHGFCLSAGERRDGGVGGWVEVCRRGLGVQIDLFLIEFGVMRL